METVASADGTTIAFDQYGDGPPVIMAVAAFNTRSATEPLARALAVWPRLRARLHGERDRVANAANLSALVYNALPSDERARAVFYGRDYGEAAALDIYGPALHGPPVVAGNNNYFLWGPKQFDGSVVIVLDGITRLVEAPLAGHELRRVAGALDRSLRRLRRRA